MTRKTITNLKDTKWVPQNLPWVTPRVLNRQLKQVIDDLMAREVSQLFESFSKSLKPKSRREWAPSLAAFLVLCLFMEAIETATETFVISQNEINMRNQTKPEYERSFSLNTCRELENLPFRQFAYQFHQIYQTHTKDASTKSFNPLVDNSFMEQGELEPAAVQMVESLRNMIHGPDSKCISPDEPTAWLVYDLELT
jgi:hypothetical protein